MSVRVNLLPEDVRQQSDANRMRAVAAALGLVLIAGMALLSFMQQGDISDAEDRLAAIEAENQALQADVAALQPFADLEARAVTAGEIVEGAMGGEVSLAGVLQDLSLVFPPSAQLETVTVTVQDELATPSAGGERLVIGALSATGQVLEGLSPGVERMLIDFGRANSFDNVFVTSSTIDEDDTATFTLETDLGPEARTDRYVVSVEVPQ